MKYKYKLIVVVDSNIKMSKGKLAREVAGAVTHVIMYHWSYYKWLILSLWYKNGFKTVVLKTDNMDAFIKDLNLYNIKYFPMVDAGDTQFNGVPTRTCVGLPIIKEEDTPDIVKELKLL